MTYNINRNENYNSLEISFTEKPSDTTREALKALKFRWHNQKKVWYGRAAEAELLKALGEAPEQTPTKKTAKKAEKANKYGVKVGDLFCASWGWEQTNVNFFQVVALVGDYSVRVREVCPSYEEEAVSGMSEYRTYKLTHEILPPCSRSVFIKDQENGDVKRIKAGYGNTPEEALANCYFKLDTFADAHKCNGDTTREYVSWYA